MRQMMIIEADTADELMAVYNIKASELGDALVNEETVSDTKMRLYYETAKLSTRPLGSDAPERIDGTCSVCPYFYSERANIAGFDHVCWGTCSRFNVHINEHHSFCSAHKKEIEKWKEVKVGDRKEQEAEEVHVG